MKKIVLISTVLSLLMYNAKSQSIQFISDSNSIRLKVGKGVLMMQVFSDKIIRVAFAPGTTIPKKEELGVIKKPEQTVWDVHEENGTIILRTKSLTVKTSLSGQVRFYDKKGCLLLSELEDGRKFTPVNDFDISTYSPEQGFVAADEGLYGLGQYQNGLMNWKNSPLQFKQFNQQDAVPFLVSTKGYGLLWNNYSVTDFNPCENEISLDTITDSVLNIRSGRFTSSITGLYNFIAISPSPDTNRFKGPVLLTANGDTIIHYNTIWVPESLSGRKFLKAGESYKFIFQNSNAQLPGKVLFNGPDYNKTIFKSKFGDLIDYYFVYGENPAAVIAGYRSLTGQAPMFGKWAYGFWQCREQYHSQAELLENAVEFRRRNIPIDNIVQDWNYWPKGTWGPEWDHSRYPNPAEMVKKLKSLNIHLMVSVWPTITNPQMEKTYNLLSHKIDTISHNLDLWDPSVQKNYYTLIRDSMFNIGVSAIWLDGTEPESHSPTAVTSMGSLNKMALTYPLMVTKSLYQGHRKDFPNKRVFNLTRSTYTGMQRYGAAYWSGDVSGTWEQFKQQVSGGLNFSLAGLPYWTTDIGGFFRDKKSYNLLYDSQYTNPEYIELLTRWFQFGTFCPLFRIHGYRSNTEVWHYGKTFENIARQYISLRYRLMPYIYSMAASVTNKGDILMKPLVYDYPSDKNTWGINNQFLFGSSILVNPITDYRKLTRSVYLPVGDWYNFWTGEKQSGGKYIQAACPIDKMPLFIKAGSIIPVGSSIQYAMERDDKPLKIYIYAGADSKFDLYEDEGENYNYEKGKYSTITFNWNNTNQTLTICKRLGSFEGMKKDRVFKIVWAGENNTIGSKAIYNSITIKYHGMVITVKK